MLAEAFREAIESNLPAQAEAARRLKSRVLVKAEDTGETFTLELIDGRPVVHEGELGSAQIRIFGDSEAILALTRLRLKVGLPDEAARLVLKRQLGGELTVRGLVLRLPQVLHLLRLLAAS